MSISKVEMYVCNKCFSYHRTEEKAINCCKKHCCKDCGTEVPIYRLRCEKCQHEYVYNTKKRITFEEYKHDMIYDPFAEKYFNDYDDMYDYYDEIREDNQTVEEVMPKYVHPCEYYPFSIDMYNVIENECSDHHDDIMDYLEDIDKVAEFVNEWCKKQKTGSYYQDYDIIIVL